MFFPLAFLDIEYAVTKQPAKQQPGSDMFADKTFRVTGNKKPEVFNKN